MMTETAFEILHYFSRSELEGMQMHSRFLRDFVDRNVDQLPLRPIYKISASVWSFRSHYSDERPRLLALNITLWSLFMRK